MKSHEFLWVRFSEFFSNKTSICTESRAIFKLQMLLNFLFSLKVCISILYFSRFCSDFSHFCHFSSNFVIQKIERIATRRSHWDNI